MPFVRDGERQVAADEFRPMIEVTVSRRKHLGPVAPFQKDILEAVAAGEGPQRFMVSLGYAGWEAGQLEREMAQNAWLSIPALPSIVFETPPAERLQAALAQLGIDPFMLSGDVGHA